MNKYKHIFFDLDHTLWDYDSNAEETLLDLYHSFELGKYGVVSDEFFKDTFFIENTILWQKLDTGEIDKFYLRNHRFRIVLAAANANMQSVPEEMMIKLNNAFLNQCPRKTKLIPGTIELLDLLMDQFEMHIITNGFEEVQTIKMQASGLAKYFGKIITSEKAGHKKPSHGIYHYSLKHTSAELESSIMIGDNLKTDIKGAIDFGMDQIYFNPEKTQHQEKVTHEIVHLNQIADILLEPE